MAGVRGPGIQHARRHPTPIPRFTGPNRYDNKPAGTGDCGGNGLCCTCVVSVTAGLQSLTPKATSEKQILARSPGRYRQSCKARIAVGDNEEARVRFVVGPRGEASLADAEAILGPEWRR